MFGFVIAINGFFFILNLLQRMEITVNLSPESIAELDNTFIFSLFDVSSIINNLTTLALFLVASTLLKSLPDFFAKLIGVGGDVTKKGEQTQNLAKVNIQEAAYFSSGYAVEDMILSKTEHMKNMPLVGSNTRAEKREKRQLAANKRAVASYRQRLKHNGISNDVAEKAVKAYEKSLQRQIEAQRARRNANKEARNARIEKHRKRIEQQQAIVEGEWDKEKDKVYCPNCSAILGKKPKQCPKCGHKFK